MAKMRDLVARVAKQDASLANDLEWTYADIALQYRKPPDPRPPAVLLRSEKPIPRAARKNLAELLDPGKMILSNITLKPVRKRGETPRKLVWRGGTKGTNVPNVPNVPAWTQQ